MPKNCFQRRFMKTRAVSGFSGAVIQRARSSRVSRRSVGLEAVGQEAGHARHDDLAALVLPVASRQDARVVSGSMAWRDHA